MAVTTTQTNKPFNPRGNDQSPKGYNRAALYSGKALDFDGVNDYVEVADNASLDFTTAMSAFCYMRVDSLSTGGAVEYAFSKYDYGNNNRSWLLGQNDNKLIAVLSKSGFSGSTNTKDRFSATFENTNEYYFVGFTFESNVLKLYVNGQEVETGNTNDAEINSIYSGSADVCVGSGQFNGGAVAFLDGKVANARAFNVALTAAQVADLYNNPEKVVPTGVDNTALKLWLPMQEGAGTTAYDGSGNGNHGTISGATYVHGVGSPVAQSAVMDWNKGGNLISYSEEFDQWNSNGLSAITADDTTSPNGLLNADKITEDTSTSYHRWYQQIVSGSELGSNQSYTISGFVKYIDRQYVSVGLSDNSAYNGLVNFDLINGTIGGEYSYNGSTISNKTITSVGNDWWRFSVTITSPTWAGGSIYAIAFLQEDSSASTGGYLGQSKSVHVWGWNAYKSTYTTPYIPTLATAQTSPVLLPQGLTSGRDITGVNLFENVRKQGALNLDGNSWAEVHDNESLDFGTGSFSLEIWSKAKYITSGSIYNVLLTLGDNVSSGSTSSLYIDSSLNYTFRYDSTLIVAGGSSEGDWSHVVGVYDGTNINIYLNGSFVVQTAASATSKTNTYSKRIGTDTAGASRTYKDQIAQPRIYNRALTAAEVLQNYNSGKNTYK